MSFADPPRRQRQSRYPALAQYEDGYRSYQDYPGEQSRPGAAQQRAPWDNPYEQQWAQPTHQWDQPTQHDLQRPKTGPFFAADEDDDDRPRLLRRRGGLLAGGVAGFLAAAVAIGVANLMAAFVRPQASPIIAVGGWFIDLTPPALKNFAVQKFGENDKNMLLLGMYVTIALIAIAIGIFAWRRVAIGVAGIGLFGLFGAVIALTRPESHVTDVIPSVIGGIVAIAALVWLHSTAARRPAYRFGRTL
jgi:hypothetical protein